MSLDEILLSYSHTERIAVAVREMEDFLQGSGRRDQKVSAACADPVVLLQFTRSRLLDCDVLSEIGRWLGEEDWKRVDAWRTLCNRWEKRWEKPRKRGRDQGCFISVWRLACMVEGWRLLDAHYLESVSGEKHLYPSVEEVSNAAMRWLSARGVERKRMETIINKAKPVFDSIALGWIPGSGLTKAPGPMFAMGCEPSILHGLTETELAEIQQRMKEFDSRRRLEEELSWLHRSEIRK